HAPENGLIAHAGSAGATALRDRSPVKDDWFANGEMPGGLYPGFRIETDAENFYPHVERQIERDLPVDTRLVFEICMVLCLAGLGFAVGNRGAAIDAVSVEIHARLPEGVHVAHAGRSRIFKTNRERCGVGAQT